MSLNGFAEKGTPPDWDMALGQVRGFRTWTLHLALRPMFDRVLLRTRTPVLTGWGKSEDYFNAPVLPMLEGAYVSGQFGGRWDYKHQHDGWYEAVCDQLPYIALHAERHAEHNPPGPDCGCGFWAYWSPDNFHYSSPWLKKKKHHNYEIMLPLAGVIAGSGATVIGDLGFRTARAQVTDLSMPLESITTYEDEDPPFNGDLIDDFYGLSFPVWADPARRQEVSLPHLLRKELGVPDYLARETIYAAVKHTLGDSFTWHDSPEALEKACPPDENYGKPA